MRIDNVLQMNDWDIKEFLIIVYSVQVAVWGVLGIDALGINIPIIRQVIVFIYLSFIPGYLFLRIFKIHKLSNIETLLYAVGLSLTFIMFFGLLVNSILPALGFNKPLSTLSLIDSFSIGIIILSIICYIRDKDFKQPSFIYVENIFSLPVLLLTILPITAIFGTYLMNFYDNNILLMLLFIMVALLAIFIGFGHFNLEKIYPYAIFVIAISLLLHTSLFSSYIWGWDIQHEYYLANLVINNSFWDYSIPYNTNGMLSIVMLAPIFSKLCGAQLIWVFKIIYPLFFSLVPVGLYHAYKIQTNSKVAFFSCFFFMSLFTFYTEMVSLARQQIAELFLVLIVLVFLSKNLNKINKSLLLIMFAFSLFVSHYGLSYIFLFWLAGVFIIIKIFDKYTLGESNKQNKVININIVCICLVFALTWYMNVTGSSTFNVIVNIGNNIISSITDLFNPESAQGLGMVMAKMSSLTSDIAKILHLLTQFFIGIGVLALITKKVKLNKEYAAFSLMNFLILIMCLAVPYFSSYLNTSRFYQISLIFLAPFCIIGFYTVSELISNSLRTKYERTRKSTIKNLSVFLVIFLFFNSGFVNEILKDNPYFFHLNTEIDGAYFNQQEVVGVKWLSEKENSNYSIYADKYRIQLCKSNIANEKIIYTDDFKEERCNTSYIYLGTFNLSKELFLSKTNDGYISLNKISNNRSKIYDNSYASILTPLSYE